MAYFKESSWWDRLNPLAPCKKYHLPLKRCPHFLFLLIGFVIIGILVGAYYVATAKIEDPKLVSLLSLFLAAILLVIDYVVVNSFERVADASRMKTEFIGVVSHQLRSPLTNVKFALELLRSEKTAKSEQDKEEYYKILSENTERMGALINDLILISRIESGEFPLTRKSISLVETTQEVVKKSHAFAMASNVEIRLAHEDNIPLVSADGLWLEQVVKNLLDNAIRYTKGKGKVEINIARDRGNVLFKIKDEGVGIPKPEQKYIFQKFFRSRNAVRHQTEGSGLGLHICQKVLELFKGKIWFQSEESKGTVFYFTLPISVAPAEDKSTL